MESVIEIKEQLINKIQNRRARIVIIGLGYVGLPLAIEFAEQNFHVQGVEIDPIKLQQINQGINYIYEDQGRLMNTVKNGNLEACGGYECLKYADCICICVPTPLNKYREPDMSHVQRAALKMTEYLKIGQLIVLESTTYPGTTDELIQGILESSGLKAGRDFFLAFSPERVDPGNKKYHIKNTPKIVGGITPHCADAAESLYCAVVEKVYKASSARVAEMEKLYENIFRAVNIALVNELALLCKKMDIDIWEVIELAKTKPFGFLPFYPGPGMGGHCIPIDPFYLTWKAREFDFNTKFIELAGEINTKMPYEVAMMIVEALSSQGKCLKNSKILLLGVAYKKDIADFRESSSLKLLEILEAKGACISYNDPYIDKVPTNGHFINTVELKDLNKYDCVVIATDHSCYEYDYILRESQLIVDTRNALKEKNNQKVFRL